MQQWILYKMEGEPMRKDSHRVETRYFEKYALLSLQRLYDATWTNFRYGEGVESPDLQSDRPSIGIEVTRAITKEQGFSERIIHEYFQKFVPERAQLYRDGVWPVQQKMQEDIAIISALNGRMNIKVHIQTLQHAMQVKTQKLNRIYRLFDKNYLYIFTFNDGYARSDIWKAVDGSHAMLQGFPIRYDLYFIDCIHFVDVVDWRLRRIQRLEVSDQTLEELRWQAIQ